MHNTAMGESGTRSVDLEALLRRCMGNEALMERMLDSFQSIACEDIELLENAIESSDNEEISRLAHKLKGTSLTVSAQSLANLADQIQSFASVGDSEEMRQYADQIRSEYSRLVQQLDMR